MKQKIYQIIFIILSIIAVVLLIFIIKKYGGRQVNEAKNKETLEVFSQINSDENTEKTKIQMDGYDVIGTVKIPKINIEYPIVSIETSNPEETKKPMKFAIVRYWGGNVNDFGNLSIAGHNNYDGTMFGKTKKLEIGDAVELTDLTRRKITYQVYDKYTVDPSDTSCTTQLTGGKKEVTLITCTDDSKQRVVVKCKEVK